MRKSIVIAWHNLGQTEIGTQIMTMEMMGPYSTDETLFIIGARVDSTRAVASSLLSTSLTE